MARIFIGVVLLSSFILSGCDQPMTQSKPLLDIPAPPPNALRPMPRPFGKTASAPQTPEVSSSTRPKLRSSSSTVISPSPLVRVTVNKKPFLLRAPENYCFDSSNSGPRGRFGFALFGGCRQNAINGILAVSIGKSNMPKLSSLPNALSKYFDQKAGLAELAQSGQSSDVKIIGKFVKNGTLYVRLQDASPRLENTNRTIWRAFFRISGHLFAVSYLPIEGRNAAPREEYDLLKDFVSQTRSVNLLRGGS